MVYYGTAGHIIAAGVVLPIVDIIAVTLKFVTRRIQRQPWKADDWLLVPAILLISGIGVVLAYGAIQHDHSIGWPLKMPTDYKGDPAILITDQLVLSRKLQYAFLLQYPLALGCTKASILFLYMRIFSVQKKTHVMLTMTIAIVAAWTISLFIAEIFQCNTKFWANWSSLNDIQTQCNKTTLILFMVALTDFIIDLVIITIPIPLVWQLKMSTPKKFGVMSIFLLGVVTVTASLIRLVIITQRVFYIESMTFRSRFISITLTLYWGMVESSIGILVACFPTIQFLIRKNRWKMVLGKPAARSSESGGAFTLQSYPARIPSQSAIYVGKTVDVTYDDVNTNPTRAGNETWIWEPQ